MKVTVHFSVLFLLHSKFKCFVTFESINFCFFWLNFDWSRVTTLAVEVLVSSADVFQTSLKMTLLGLLAPPQTHLGWRVESLRPTETSTTVCVANSLPRIYQHDRWSGRSVPPWSGWQWAITDWQAELWKSDWWGERAKASRTHVSPRSGEFSSTGNWATGDTPEKRWHAPAAELRHHPERSL